jgi:hypothetical protein
MQVQSSGKAGQPAAEEEQPDEEDSDEVLCSMSLMQ